MRLFQLIALIAINSLIKLSCCYGQSFIVVILLYASDAVYPSYLFHFKRFHYFFRSLPIYISQIFSIYFLEL